MNSISDPRNVPLPTTLWYEIRRAGEGSHQALESLATAYWRPVYAYLRATGRNPETARDLTQGFFLDLLEHRFFSRATPEHGRFRNYLLAALRHHLADQHDRETALKRGEGKTLLSLDVEAVEASLDLGTSQDPGQIFEREWALLVLERAMNRLKEEATPALCQTFQESMKGVAHAELSERLGCSEQEVANRLHRARRRLRELLIDELRSTVDDPRSIDEEIGDLMRTLGS